MLFGFMVDGRMVEARVVGGEVTATMAPVLSSRRGVYMSQAKGQSFPKEQMKVSKGLVRFLDKEGNVAAELTHWNGGGNLTVAPRKVPVRLGITLAEPKLGFRGGKPSVDGRQTVLVDEVAPEGPADKAGIQAGDAIIEINGQKPATEELLRKALKGKKPGDTFKVKALRDGKELDLTATLEAAPEKADPYDIVGGRLDATTVRWRRGQVVRARKDIEALAARQAALQALLQKQAAKIRKEVKGVKKEGALQDPKAAPEDKKQEAVDVFRQIQTELKKSSEKALEHKKELDAKLDELKAEEARQNAMVWMNRVNQRQARRTLVPERLATVKPVQGKDKKPDPLAATTLQRLVLVDPRLTSKLGDTELSHQVRDLEKRLARIETLLEQGLSRQREVDSRQREAERKAAQERHLRNHKNELDAKIRELKRAEGWIDVPGGSEGAQDTERAKEAEKAKDTERTKEAEKAKNEAERTRR